jgi:hypothetical protein
MKLIVTFSAESGGKRAETTVNVEVPQTDNYVEKVDEILAMVLERIKK